MNSDDVEKRILAARAEEQHKKDTAEFLLSLGPNDELVRPIHNPEAFIMRNKARAAAARGEITKPGCTHPLYAIKQFIDQDPTIKRRNQPLNLFECTICSMILWLTDPWGDEVSDD